jgi:hypothetical protein
MSEAFALGDLILMNDVSSSDWIVSSVGDFGKGVRSLLPVTFPAYARVMHPAGRTLIDGSSADVRWSEVAAANGRIAHPAMEWVAITGDWDYMYRKAQPGIWDRGPSIGSLPRRQATLLAGALGRCTTTPQRCWFAIWDGDGAPRYPRDDVSKVLMPQRSMVLFRGPLDAVTTSFTELGDQRASLWWPEDRAWCVATDVDLMSTYVGGSVECVAAILGELRLESFRISVDQSVAWNSDTINPTPEPPPPTVASPKLLSRLRGRRFPHPRGSGPHLQSATNPGPRPTPPGDTPGQ